MEYMPVINPVFQKLPDWFREKLILTWLVSRFMAEMFFHGYNLLFLRYGIFYFLSFESWYAY